MSILRLRIHEGHPSGWSMCPHLVGRIAAASDTVSGDTEQFAYVARLFGGGLAAAWGVARFCASGTTVLRRVVVPLIAASVIVAAVAVSLVADVIGTRSKQSKV